MNLGPTLVTLGAILGKKSHFYGLKSPIFVTIWSLRTNIEIYIKIDFYLMRGYAQCAPAGCLLSFAVADSLEFLYESKFAPE